MKTIAFAANKAASGRPRRGQFGPRRYSNRGKPVLLIDFDSQGHAFAVRGMRGTKQFSPASSLLPTSAPSKKEAAAHDARRLRPISRKLLHGSADNTT